MKRETGKTAYNYLKRYKTVVHAAVVKRVLRENRKEKVSTDSFFYR